MNPWVSVGQQFYRATFPSLAMNRDYIGGILTKPLFTLRHDGEYLRYVG